MTTTIHVDRERLVANFNTGEEEPVLVVERMAWFYSRRER